ncbi:MAG: HAD-IIIC family phosphatase [Deltaproteobacteria bacterium]|nr:HAD-IIIC family phosphatase [Deltaproteobacteria bacterium]
MAGQEAGAYLVDLDRLQAALGYSNFIDNRMWHLAKAPYTLQGAKALAGEYLKFIRAARGKAKKCLTLDCDNTLWGGILGEEGLNRIKLGRVFPGSAFREFQEALLELYHRGVMLALCSKNNQAEVMEVLEKHPDMVLRPEHFVSMRINWQDKASNLAEMAQELNLGLDSFVLADDSQFEISLVQRLLPQVETIHLSGDPSQFSRIIRSCGLFDTLSYSSEDRQRPGCTVRRPAGGRPRP